MRFMRLLSLIIAATMTLSFTSVPVSSLETDHSSDITLYYVIAASVSSNLSISGNTATCRSTGIGSTSTVTVSAIQTLEKHWGLWIWNSVSGAAWTKTVNASNIVMYNTKSGLTSGTYRVRTDYTFTDSSGQVEEITVYSSEVTIP